MTYAALVALYPYLERVMDKLARSLEAGLAPDAMLDWALRELARVKNDGHRNAAATKVMMLIDAVMGGKDHDPNRATHNRQAHPDEHRHDAVGAGKEQTSHAAAAKAP